MVAYIDDIGVGTASKLDKAKLEFKKICNTVCEMGLKLAPDKCEGPFQVMSWTGTTYNTVKMTMRVEKSKIDETLDLIKGYIEIKYLTVKEMEVLLGKLQHALKFVPGGRRFLNRLLEMRRGMGEIITFGALEDLDWFIKFLHKFNCQAVNRSQFIASVTIHVDACLIGAGGVWEDNKFLAYR